VGHGPIVPYDRARPTPGYGRRVAAHTRRRPRRHAPGRWRADGMSYDSPYGTLARILMSRHVGLTHIRLAGEVVVAQAGLNEWLSERGKATVPPGDWIELVERVLAIEGRYK